MARATLAFASPCSLLARARPTAPSSPRRAPRASLSALPRGAAAAAAAAALALGGVPGVPLAGAPGPADASLFHFAGERPKGLGVRAERYLAFCPPSPNCISSLENVYDSHYVPSWTYAGGAAGAAGAPAKTMDEAVGDVLRALAAVEKETATVVESRATRSELGAGHYVYAEFSTPLMGFVDDVEFLFNPDGRTVEYRSASRLGKDDLKANRTRIRELRRALQAADPRWASTGY